MKVTNVLNLPEAFVKAVSVRKHNAEGCYSATTLNKGTKEIILESRHWDELTVDAADEVWAVFGTAVHALMESIADSCFHEESYKTAVLNSTVTGTADSYDLEHEILYDWKTASSWKVIYKDFEDWKKQGLTYAWLMHRAGLNVKKCRFVALLKDHSKTQAERDGSYPQSPCTVYEFDVTADLLDETEKRIFEKIADIEAAEKLPDDDIPECTPEERWATPTKYAVMKEGRKSAISGGVCDTLEEAEKLAAEKGKGHYVETRRGEDKKCKNYCLCKKYCSYYNQYVKTK